MIDLNRPLDLLILSNGPGELSTWVRPVVRALRRQFGEDRSQVRISLVLSPCPNSSGQEVAIAQHYPEIDRIQPAHAFWPFLLQGKTFENWDWRSQGVVIFLGGDQFFPVIISKRLGYGSLIYAEWEARWLGWSDRFALRRPESLTQIPEKYRYKCAIVGDLMADTQTALTPSPASFSPARSPLIGLLAGSKAAKLTQGMPFVLSVAEILHQQRPDLHCFIPVAPSQTPESLLRYAQAEFNPYVKTLGSPTVKLVERQGQPYFQTPSGCSIELYQAFPAYDRLTQSTLCLTTVGANTAELGALAVPMIVLLPTQQLDAMRAWNGIPGLLANLPVVGSLFAKGINAWMLNHLGLLAWPNLWAGEMIVPELVGKLEPTAIAQQVLDYLDHPEKLEEMRDRLRQVRGQPGAADRLVRLMIS